MSVLGILFWLWLAVSVVVLVQRRVRRRAERRSGGAAAPDAPSISASTAATDGRTSPGTAPAGPDRAPSHDIAPEVADDDRDGAADSTPEVGTTPDPLTADNVVSTDGPEIGGATDATVTGGRPLGIADALSGIRMPCDLAPLTLEVTDLDPDHVDLVTTGAGPGAVAQELGIELTRLGYVMTDLGAGEKLATRGETVVRVKVHDRPAVSVGVDGRGFPTAPADGVVVELTLS